MVGLITNNDETAYREEVRALGVWCQENNVSLNVNKKKEMIMDLIKQQSAPPPTPPSTGKVLVLGVHIKLK